jgi:uracil-DNA glycosylase family 4
MIGEAPGKAEDSLGEPFVGPSGRLLEVGLKDALQQAGLAFRPSIFITNIVACRPTDERGGMNREPSPDEIRACSERVLLTAEVVNPEVVVLLGDVAARGFRRFVFPRVVRLRHPAYVAREGGTDSSEYVSFVRGLTEMLKGLNIRTVRKKGVGCGS